MHERQCSQAAHPFIRRGRGRGVRRSVAADLQIASTVRLVLTLADARPLIEGRPCAELARRLFPDADGEMPVGSLPQA